MRTEATSKRYRWVLLALAVCFVPHCKSGDEEPAKDSKAGGAGPAVPAPADEDEPVLPVPIGLLDPTFIAATKATVSPFGANPSTGTDADAIIEKLTNKLGMFDGQGRGKEQLVDGLTKIEALFTSLFGANGLMSHGVKAAASGADVKYQLAKDPPVGAAAYAIVSVIDGKSKYRVQIFVRTQDALQKRFDVSFATSTLDAARVVASFAYFDDPQADGATIIATGTFDAAKNEFDAAYARTMNQVSVSKNLSKITFSGTIPSYLTATIEGPATRDGKPFDPALGPPYFPPQRRQGDLDLIASHRAASGEEAMTLAYVAASELGEYQNQPERAFAERSYASYGDASLTATIRSETIHAECSGYGDKLGITTADLCRHNQDVTDLAVSAARRASCAKTSALPAILNLPKGDRTIDICLLDRLLVDDLANPVLFAPTATGRQIVPHAAATPAHQSLMQGFDAEYSWFNLAALSDLSWPKVEVRTMADFATARTIPRD